MGTGSGGGVGGSGPPRGSTESMSGDGGWVYGWGDCVSSQQGEA